MNTNERDDGDVDPVLDWALGERLGGERPPDLIDAVRERFAHDAVAVAPGPARAGTRLLVAALVLLGVGVVVGVATWPRGGGGVAPVAAQDRALVRIDMLTDVAALPPDTRHVEVVGVHDVKFAELARLRELETLVVREPWNEQFGLSLKVAAPRDAYQVTAAIWATIAGFTKLQRLELHGTEHVAFFYPAGVSAAPEEWRDDPARAAAAFAALERLPMLERLVLRCCDTPDELLAELPKLRGLRALDLSFNHGFVGAGVQAIAQCRGLRQLVLRGCQQLHGNELALLAQLTGIEQLDLSMIDGINWRVGQDEDRRVIRALRAAMERGRRAADRLGMGPTQWTLQALAACKQLRVLDVSGSNYLDAAALTALGGIPSLRELDIGGSRAEGSAWVRSLPPLLGRLELGGPHADDVCAAIAEHLTVLRDLTIAACERITDRGLAAVAAMPSLRRLDMRQMRGLTAASIDALAAATQLEALDVRHCDFVTATHVVRLRRSLPRLRELEHSVPPDAIAADQAALQEPVEWVQVRGLDDLELRVGKRHIVAFDVEDDVMAKMRELRDVERLSVVAAWTGPEVRRPDQIPPLRSITDAGLRELGSLTALRVLRLDGQLGVRGPGLEIVPNLPLLQELTLHAMSIDDAGMQHVARAPRLTALEISDCQGFGRDALPALAKSRSLRRLSLAGCSHLESDWLVLLEQLPLEALDLSRIGSHTRFSGLARHLPPADPGSGVTDQVLTAIAGMTTLRELSLGQAGITATGLARLRSLPALMTLDLSGIDFVAANARSLPPSLRSLTLRGCQGQFAALGDELAAALPQLATLDLVGSAIGRTGLESLRAARSLRSLDLSYCPRLGPAGAEVTAAELVAALTAMPWLEGLTLRGLMPLGDAERAALRAMPNLQRLDDDTGTHVLRAK